MRAFWQSLRRIGNVFLKSMREIWRDWLTLSLSLVFAPLFILLYYLITAGGSTSYRVIVINLDERVAGSGGEMVSLGSEVIQAIEAVTYADGQPMLRVSQAASQAEAEAMLRERAATAFVILWHAERIYEPRMEKGERETLYSQWGKAVMRSLNWDKKPLSA